MRENLKNSEYINYLKKLRRLEIEFDIKFTDDLSTLKIVRNVIKHNYPELKWNNNYKEEDNWNFEYYYLNYDKSTNIASVRVNVDIFH